MQAEIERLGKEHGYSAAQLAKIKKVAWPADCKVGDSLEESCMQVLTTAPLIWQVGDSLEESVNVEGKGATLNAEYAAKKKANKM